MPEHLDSVDLRFQGRRPRRCWGTARSARNVLAARCDRLARKTVAPVTDWRAPRVQGQCPGASDLGMFQSVKTAQFSLGRSALRS